MSTAMTSAILSLVPALTILFGSLAAIFFVGIVKELMRLRALDRPSNSRLASKYFANIAFAAMPGANPQSVRIFCSQHASPVSFGRSFTGRQGYASAFVFRPLQSSTLTESPGVLTMANELGANEEKKVAASVVTSGGSMHLTVEAAA
jgi:hypothetical protein